MQLSKVAREEWRSHKAMWESSGLSRRLYCSESGLCYQKFNYHMRKLNSNSSSRPFSFIEARGPILSIASKKEKNTIRIELPNGIGVILELSASQTLSQVISIAGGVTC